MCGHAFRIVHFGDIPNSVSQCELRHDDTKSHVHDLLFISQFCRRIHVSNDGVVADRFAVDKVVRDQSCNGQSLDVRRIIFVYDDANSIVSLFEASPAFVFEFFGESRIAYIDADFVGKLCDIDRGFVWYDLRDIHSTLFVSIYLMLVFVVKCEHFGWNDSCAGTFVSCGDV